MTKILVIDVGGTKTLASVMDETYRRLSSLEVPSDVSSQAAELAVIEKLVAQVLKQTQIEAIGIDTVGRVDPASGTWYGINSQIAQTVALTQHLTKLFKVPAFAMNDVYAATYAELAVGLGRQTENFIYLNIGTGIAGRNVVNDEIQNGANQYAGEYGHMVVDPNVAKPCSCGRTGCVESFASGLGMSNEAKRLIDEGMSSQLVVDARGRIGVPELMAAYDDDVVARAVVDHAVIGLHNLIGNLVRENDPSGIVVGGGVVHNDRLFEMVTTALEPSVRKCLQYGVTRTTLDPSLVASLGAAHAVFDSL